MRRRSGPAFALTRTDNNAIVDSSSSRCVLIKIRPRSPPPTASSSPCLQTDRFTTERITASRPLKRLGPLLFHDCSGMPFTSAPAPAPPPPPPPPPPRTKKQPCGATTDRWTESCLVGDACRTAEEGWAGAGWEGRGGEGGGRGGRAPS